MFRLDEPNVYKVLTNNEFILNEINGAGGGGGGNEQRGGGGGGSGEEQMPSSPGEWGIFKRGQEDARNKQIVVVSIFGSSFYQAVPRNQRGGFKRAFQLAIDAFGTVGLYEREEYAGEKGKDEHFQGGSTTSPGGPRRGTVEETVDGAGAVVGNGENEEEGEGERKPSERRLTSEQISIGGTLEGFFNEDESVLFLHLDGFAYDAAACMQACQELRSSIKESGFQSVWSTFNSSYCKWLLLLFSLSHVMLISETGGSFDTSYISLFRAVDGVRLDVLSSVSTILSTIDGLPRQWVEHSRLCSPRLVFLFEIETESPSKFQHTALSSLPSSSSSDSTTGFSFKQRRALLQKEIYQILRKCRLITNITANSLFALPNTDDFVYIFDRSAQNALPNGGQSLPYTFLELINASLNLRKCQHQKAAAAAAVGSPSASMSSFSTTLPMKSHFRSAHDTLTYSDTVQSFRQFLMSHVSLALGKGFDDDYSRVCGSKHFFIRPTLQQWEQAYRKLYYFLILEPSGSQRISDAYIQMDRKINVNSEYLEMQCGELFYKAFAAYQRSLPKIYTSKQHQKKLSYAVDLFLNMSRGPEVSPWVKKLAEKCERYWKNGRQQCETTSLLGHCCSQPVHRIRRGDHLETLLLPELIDPDLSEMSHRHISSVRMLSFCNCGRRQMCRKEPFTIRQANYEYYKKVGKDCCDKLESHAFPVFTPNREENSMGEQQEELSLDEMIVILQRRSDALQSVAGGETGFGEGGKSSLKTIISENEKQKHVENGDLEEEELSEVFEAELQQEASDDNEDLEEEEEEDDEDEMAVGKFPLVFYNNNNKEGDTPVSRGLFKQHSSTVEYLPGMYHSKSPLGLLPLFPSWSLVCLGPSSIYSHFHGVTQKGFISLANSLLPWDVKVKAEKGVMYVPPSILLRQGRTRQPRSLREILGNSGLPPSATAGKATSRAGTTDQEEFSVKVFIGFEYECRQGHRFFCDSQEKILYAMNVSHVSQKTIAEKMIGCDMPIYVYCPCKMGRESKQIAQLIRVHVVTPKAPVFVTLSPKVQPRPGAPIFTPSPPPNGFEDNPGTDSSDAIKLTPSTYWVLRLPYCYVGEEMYLPSADLSRCNGKLLKGIFNVVSMSTEELEEWKKQDEIQRQEQ